MEVKPGYKQTEVGVIPEEWDVRRLKDCCQKLNVSFVGTCEPFYTRENTGVLMLRTGNLQGDKIVLDDCKFVTREFHARNRKSQVRTGDILIARHGNSGNAVPVPAGIDDVNALSIVILRTHEVVLGHLFACYCINSGAVRSQTVGMLAGSTQVIINTREVEKLRLPLPPLPQQRAIATALSDVDGLLGGLDGLIAKKRDLKQAAMQQLLTGQTRLPGFHGEWEVKRLGDFGKCLRGVSYKGDSDLSTHDTTHTKRLLRSNNVQNAVVVTDEVQFVNAARVSSHQILQQNDILICMANGSKALVGKAGIFTLSDGHEYTFGAFMGCFRTNSAEANPAFVFYLFLTARYRDYINNLLAGSSINNLRPSSIESLEFSTPLHHEQTAIAEVLTEMDGELAVLEQRREKTRALKQAMMQELLTGRTRLV